MELTNNTNSQIVVDENCSLRISTVDKNDKPIASDVPESFKQLPVSVSKGSSKTLKFTDATEGYWSQVVFTIKVGSSYKTIYSDGYGMVAKVADGRKF